MKICFWRRSDQSLNGGGEAAAMHDQCKFALRPYHPVIDVDRVDIDPVHR